MKQEILGLHPTRRDILALAAAITAAATTLGRNFATAQAAANRIDVHHHFFPPTFLEARRALR
jgi:hypothetical protein